MKKPTLKITTLLAGALSVLPAHAEEPEMDEHVHELEDFVVVTTATRTERLLKDVPIKTELIGGENFDSTAKYDLGQAIELLNGARTENNCQNCGAAEIQLLGLPGRYNQVLVDGLPLFTGVASVYGIDQVPTIFVDRIEVVKGGGSALYGPGAVAGVINLIPEEPFESHFHSTADYFDIDGSDSYVGQFAGFYVPDEGPFKMSVYGQYSDQDEYDANNDGFTELSERENASIGTYMWYDLSEKSRLRLNSQYIYEDRRGGDNLGREEYESDVAEAAETDYYWSTLRWEYRVDEDFDYALSASGVYLERDSYYGGASTVDDPADARNMYGDLESFTYYLDAQFNYYLGEIWKGEHTLTWGVQYEDEDIDEDRVDDHGDFIETINDAQYDNFGVYVQDQWQVTERLEFVPGLRFDDTSTLDDGVLSPRIAGRYSVNNEWTLRGNFSSGFLAPRVFDEDLHIAVVNGDRQVIKNADDLEEERSYTFSVGTDFTPDALHGKLVTSLQIYYTILEDSFIVEDTGNTDNSGASVFERTNTDGSTIYGAEWDVALSVDNNWSLNAGLAYNHSRYDEDQVIFEGNDVTTDKYNKTPEMTGLVQVNYDNPDFIDGFIALKWTGTMDVAHTLDADNEIGEIEESDDFYVVDIGISKTFELRNGMALTLRGGVNNIFDEYQGDFDKGADRDVTYVYGPRLPRTYTIGAKLDF